MKSQGSLLRSIGGAALFGMGVILLMPELIPIALIGLMAKGICKLWSALAAALRYLRPFP